jgi:hypothetical protein
LNPFGKVFFAQNVGVKLYLQVRLANLIVINAKIVKWITHMNTGNIMKNYRISIWGSIEVEAEDVEDALDQANDLVIGCSIKSNEWEFDVNEID